MRAIRALLALLITGASIAFIVRMAIPRLECNLAKGRINRQVMRLGNTGDEFRRITEARRSVEICRKCIAAFPRDHHWYFLLGLNLRILDEREEAVRNFEQSLALAERPEVYARLAEVQVELGNVEAARAALLQAATFQIAYAEAVDGPLRLEIQNVVLERYQRLTGTKPDF